MDYVFNNYNNPLHQIHNNLEELNLKSMKLSKKKSEELYTLIHNDIMDARIKLCRLSDIDLTNSVNDIMADLCYKTPERAINLFKTNKPCHKKK